MSAPAAYADEESDPLSVLVSLLVAESDTPAASMSLSYDWSLELSLELSLSVYVSEPELRLQCRPPTQRPAQLP